jgi:hypothetical protein
MGLALSLIGGADIALAWYPFNLGNSEWEFGTVTATLDGLPLLALGLALVLGAAVARGRRAATKTVAVGLVLLAVLIALAAILYATNVPIALQSVSDPLVKTGLKKAIVKTALQAVVYPCAFVWLALKGWRHSSGRR